MDDRVLPRAPTGATPPGLADHRRVAETAGRAFLRVRRARLDDLDAIAAAHRRHIDPSASDEQIKALASELKRSMPDPDGRIELTPEAQFQSLFLNVSHVALVAAALDWTLLVSDDEFIENDRGLAMWDPDLPPTAGNMWMSSQTAETTVPVAPNVCLKLTPGGSCYTVEPADRTMVDEINLRSYGWAQEKIFGTSTRVVRDVHAKAKDAPLSSPVAPKIHGQASSPSA